MAYNIETTIDIEATPEWVWEVLTTFEEYPNWNPFVRSIEGEFRTGAKITVELQPPGGSSMKMKPRLLVTDENEELRWLGHLLIPGIFDGEHYFRIETNERGTVRFVHGENFGGILVPFMKKILDGSTTQGFIALNEALKKVCERNVS